MLDSIRGRLTLWLALLFALCLIAFALFLYTAVAQVLTDDLDHTLRAQAQQVAASYDFGGPETAGNATGQHADIGALDQFATGGIQIEVFDPRGRLLARSTNLGAQVLRLPAHAAALRSGSRLVNLTTTTGQERVYSGPAARGGQVLGLVLVAASLHLVRNTTQTLIALLLIGGLLGIVLAAVGSTIVVRRGLRPLGEMAAVAERINARRLDQRLGLRRPREIARLAHTFDAMLDRLREAFAAQNRFVADAAHELRTPLAIIHGRAEVLLVEPVVDPATREGIEMIRDEAGRMSRLVTNLLLLARGEEERAIDRRPIELDDLLAMSLRQIRTLAHGVTVTSGRVDRALVLGDADLLRQALLNLLDNALTYTPSGGHVDLSLIVASGEARLSVRDSGPGIAAADLERIFERFFRLDRARSRRRGGAGLGLAITRWIVEAHGGRVEVASVVGQGSTFTLVLPVL